MSGSMDRRVDQGSQPPVSVVPPSTAAGILRARQVIIFGTGPTTGLFIYNGTPGLGNPPQFAAVPTGVTQDPFGNAITSSKVLIQGNVITTANGLIRTSPTVPLIQLDGANNVLEFYNAASGLAETIAPVATSDGLGDSVVPGFATYTTTAPFIALQLFQGEIQWQTASSQGGPWTANGPLISLSAGDLGLQSGTNVAAVIASITLHSGATASQTLIGMGGSPVAVGNISPAPSNTLSINSSILFANAGHLQTVSTATGGDGNNYGTERLIQRTTATQQFTLASAVAITSLSVNLGVGSYHVSLKVFWVPSGVVGSTHVHNFAFTGTATGNVNGQCWQAQAANAVQQTALNAGAGNNLTANLTSPTHVAFAGWTELEADITVTVAGTLTHTITLTTAGDDITTSAGTFWEVKPL